MTYQSDPSDQTSGPEAERPGTEAVMRIAFLSAGTPEAEAARVRLIHTYGNCDPAHADVIVALGGDGLMLQTLHRFMGTQKPIYGMNRGSVGFLMNEFREHDLERHIRAAQPSIIHPLL